MHDGTSQTSRRPSTLALAGSTKNVDWSPAGQNLLRSEALHGLGGCKLRHFFALALILYGQRVMLTCQNRLLLVTLSDKLSDFGRVISVTHHGRRQGYGRPSYGLKAATCQCHCIAFELCAYKGRRLLVDDCQSPTRRLAAGLTPFPPTLRPCPRSLLMST